MNLKTPSNISFVTDKYPSNVLSRFEEFRNLVLGIAENMGDLKWMEESLKWNEPSFRSNIGSPVRFGWNDKSPNQFGLYFICTTTLVETFHQLYPDFFQFDGNRGLLFQVDEVFPAEPLSLCLQLALRYKKVRDLPLLGA